MLQHIMNSEGSRLRVALITAKGHKQPLKRFEKTQEKISSTRRQKDYLLDQTD